MKVFYMIILKYVQDKWGGYLMLSNESNSSKSKNGNDLNKDINKILKKALDKKLIASFEKEPRYNYPGYTYEQFSPDFEITLNDGSKIIIDNTTTARHDRFKQKQWDAYGIKSYFKSEGVDNVQYFIVLPNDDCLGSPDKRKKEINNYMHEKDKISSGEYFSVVDDIIQVEDLKEIINGSNE